MLSELYRPQEERIILVCVSTHLWLALISLHAAEDVLNLTLDVLLWRAGSGGQYLSSQPLREPDAGGPCVLGTW